MAYIQESVIDSIIRRARESSEEINDYFEEFRYYGEVENQEEVTPQFLRDKAISLVLAELAEIGISFGDTSELINNPFAIEVMFWLRTKFDRTYFYNFLKSLDEENYTQFEGVVENIFCPEDYLLELSVYLKELLPLDTGWDYIERATDLIQCDENFSNHINALIEEVNTNVDPNKIEIEEDEAPMFGKFLQTMEERQNVARQFTQEALKVYPELNANVLRVLVRDYDKEKLYPTSNLKQWVHYDETASKVEPEFVKQHHLEVPHHLEYYKGKNEFPTREMFVMIMISLWLDNKSCEDIKNDIFKTFEMSEEHKVDLLWVESFCSSNILKSLTGGDQ